MKARMLLVAAAVTVGLALAACGGDSKKAEQTSVGNAPGIPELNGTVTKTATGLQYIDEKVGDGASPTTTSQVTVNYTGWLTDGTKFDASADHGGPSTLPLNGVIPGWTEGLATMKVGGKRRLVIPSELGYGARAQGPIPANSTLIFDVELVAVQ